MPIPQSATPGIRVYPVTSTRDRERFIRLPERLYRNTPEWVPPLRFERREFLNPAKNPFFDHADVQLFLAVDATDHVRGRIAAIVNHTHVARHREPVGFFGLFESEHDITVARALFDAAADFLRTRGMQTMRGPANMSVNDDIGLLTDGFDTPPSIMMPYNPPFYLDLLQECGFASIMRLWAYVAESDQFSTVPERFVKGVELVRRRYNYTVRPINMKAFDDEIRLIHEVYNRAWEDNWGALPMTDREFAHMAASLKLIVDPDLLLIAEVDGKPAGFSMALPDLNQALIKSGSTLFPFGLLKLLWYRRRVDGLRLLTMGVVKEYRMKGVDVCFYYETISRALAKGYRRLELSWILEINEPMNRVLEKAGARIRKTYQLYDRQL